MSGSLGLAPGPSTAQIASAFLKTRSLLGFLDWCADEYGESFRLPLGGGRDNLQ